MKKHIEKLKQRPYEERKKLATVFAVVVTAIIVILWLVILSVFKTPKQEITQPRLQGVEEALGGIGEQFFEIENQFNQEKEIFENLEQEIEQSEEQEILLDEITESSIDETDGEI